MKSLATKLIKLQEKITPVEKDGHNAFHGYDYATEAGFIRILRPLLIENNLVILSSVKGSEIIHKGKDKNGNDVPLTRVMMEFTIVDADSGESFTGGAEGYGSDALDKGIYKAITGATKYFLAKCFQIPTGDDPEHDSGNSAVKAVSEAFTRPQTGSVLHLKTPAESMLGNCKDCGTANKLAKTGKPYCGAKCWLSPNTTPVIQRDEEIPPPPFAG